MRINLHGVRDLPGRRRGRGAWTPPGAGDVGVRLPQYRMAPFRLCTLAGTWRLHTSARALLADIVRHGRASRELCSATHFFSQRAAAALPPPTAYQLSWCCSVYRDRVPRAMRGPRSRSRRSARGGEPPDRSGSGYSRHTASLSELLSRPPSPTGTSTGTYRHAAARRRQGTAAGTAGHASKRGKANALYRSISLAAAPRSCMRLRLWQFRP